jgi:putative nucleotidyltransferase with HDIG domain
MTEFNNEKITKLATEFKKHGKELYMVGGAVRDMLMGSQPQDYDFATNATAAEMRAMFSRTIPTGEKHGTITILIDGESFEVTTYRTEGEYSDGRRPDYVLSARNIESDLSRRDFTMNAIAFDPLEKIRIDPFCGALDIQHKIIRCVGNAKDRFMEDGLRVMRAIRFIAQLEFVPDYGITGALERMDVIDTLDRISPERIRDELDKILMTARPLTAFKTMHRFGILYKIIPELRACYGQRQNEHHRYDVLKHTLLAVDKASDLGAPLHVRLAALFHDIGKPHTAALKEDGLNYSFLGHEDKSAEMAKAILERLKYPNAIRDKVTHLVKFHMKPLHYNHRWKKPAVRRFIVRVGVENLDALFFLNAADLYASATHDCAILDELKERVREVLEEKPALNTKAVAINGNDLIAIGFREGPEIGKTLEYLFDAVLESPELNTRERLLDLAKERL